MKKTDSNEKRGGIYIHIPFCVRKCAYCDFLSAPADEKTQAEYVKALQTEIYQTAKLLSENPYTVDTVFFGGGTPSILAPGHVKALADTLRESFPFAENAEITIECNPGTLDEEKAAVYRQAGINRISFGLQSANNRELKMLGRIHTMEEFVKSYETARAAGFDNINIDLMSALPGQTFESFLHTLDTVLALKPEHISMYSLILEEGTALYEHLDRYPALPDEDTEREMYDTAVGSSAVGTPCSSTASSAAQVPGLPALTTISAVKILSNRSAISGSYSLSTRRSRRKNSARLSRSSSGISISARRSLDSAFEPIRLTRRLTTAATRAAASGTDWLLRFSATFPPIPPSMHVTCGIHYRRLRNTFDTDCALPHKSIFCIAKVFALNGRISRWTAYTNGGIPHKCETPP